MGTGTIFRERRAPMDIEKAKYNFNKKGKPRCFNCNIYKNMAKECQKPKKNNKMRKCYNCNKVGHLAKDCRLRQKIKTRSMQKESDEKDDNNKESFVKGSEQAQYNKPLYIVISKIDILF